MDITRRELLKAGKVAGLTLIATPLLDVFSHGLSVSAQAQPLAAAAGVDRVVMKNGKTYLNGWAGYGATPRPGRQGGGGRGGGAAAATPTPPPAPAPTVAWSKVSGPGAVTFADAKAAVTTATFSETGDYVLKVVADNGAAKAESTLTVKVELPPPPVQLAPVVTTRHTVTSPFWKSRTKALITSWIPHCVAQINRTDLIQGANSGSGGIDNFVEAAKALKGEPATAHKGYVFSNAWVYQTVESISLALMVDPEGDREIAAAQTKLKVVLDDWIPKILAAQHPDGYLQTAYTLRGAPPAPGHQPGTWRGTERWTSQGRGNHEGYTAGYFIESAINHYSMTDRKDARLYQAAKKLADCWVAQIGPAPKQEWFDGHQEMEQALVRFGRFVNEVEAGRQGDKYISLAKFLLDCRRGGSEYDQSHLPVQQQYEAVGHAVRAVYSYSGMADVAVETHDVDYQSAVKSLWDNIVHKKYYVTGGVGSGETAEGFGPNYSLRNNSYCETCSSCGEVFFQWKLHLAYRDAKYADLYEQTLYNALYGGLDLAGTTFYYTNPLDQNAQRTTWHSCPCCVGNLARTMLMLPTWTYSKAADGIYVNLFVGSSVMVPGVAGTDVEMVQTTDYPWAGSVMIAVNPAATKSFTVRVRVPDRDVSSLYRSTPAANGLASLSVNGAVQKPVIKNGYAEITRAWKKGDTIALELPMVPQRVYASDKIMTMVQGKPDYPTKDKVALRFGPLVYNLELVDQDITQALPSHANLTTEFKRDLLGGVLVLKGRFADGSPMMAIPNFARYNRNPPAPLPPPPTPRPSPTASVTPAPQASASPTPRPAPPVPQSIVWIKER